MSIDGGLGKLFREHLAEFHWQRIETGGTGRGIPDSNYCVRSTLLRTKGDGIEGWVEFKTTDGWVLGLRPEQVGWISRRVRAGGRVWVAVRRRHKGGKRKGDPVDQLWLVPGTEVVAVQASGLEPYARGDYPTGLVRLWSGGPGRWDWDEVRWLLLS